MRGPIALGAPVTRRAGLTIESRQQHKRVIEVGIKRVSTAAVRIKLNSRSVLIVVPPAGLCRVPVNVCVVRPGPEIVNL